MISSLLSGRLTGRAGPRRPMLVGLLCGAVGFAGLIVAGRATPYAVLVAPLIAAGFGMAFTMPAATAAVIEAADKDRAAIASGVLNASRQAGGAIGVAVLGTAARRWLVRVRAARRDGGVVRRLPARARDHRRGGRSAALQVPLGSRPTPSEFARACVIMGVDEFS